MRGNIIKSGMVCLLSVAVLGLLPIEANAFSLQVRGGGGVLSLDREEGDGQGEYSQVGADIFFYEGRNLELFLGAENLQGTSTDAEGEFSGGASYNADYSFKYTAVTYGLRLKPALSGRWKPYLALGGVGGTADFEVTGIRNAVLLSKSKDSATFGAGRVGLGMDVGLSTRFSLGMEANATGTWASFKAVVASPATGEVKETRIDGVSTIGFSIGLRYAF